MQAYFVCKMMYNLTYNIQYINVKYTISTLQNNDVLYMFGKTVQTSEAWSLIIDQYWKIKSIFSFFTDNLHLTNKIKHYFIGQIIIKINDIFSFWKRCCFINISFLLLQCSNPLTLRNYKRTSEEKCIKISQPRNMMNV